jgi:Tfp pilus assembly protein PilF
VVYLRVDAETREQAARLGFDWQAPPQHAPAVPAFLAPRDWLAGVPRVPAVSALEQEGGFLIRRGNLALAETRLRRAIQLAPGSRPARLQLGMILEARGDQGARALLAGLEHELEREEVLALRSFIASLAGNAERAYELRQRSSVDTPAERRDLARLALQNRAYDEAERTLRALVNDDPSDGESWALLGDLEFTRQRLDAALGYYETAIAAGAAQARVLFNVGTIHAIQQRFPAARAAFEQALAVDPEYTRARDSLARLASMGH